MPKAKSKTKTKRAAKPKVMKRTRRYKKTTALMNSPESKYSYIQYPLSGTYEFTNAFATVWPSSYSAVDLAPGQGTSDIQRIGNEWMIKDYQIDLRFQCRDNNVQGRFICFQWLNDASPDTINAANFVFNTPIGSGAVAGAGWNPFFEAKSCALYKILYQKYVNFAKEWQPYVLSSSTAGVPSPIKIKKTLSPFNSDMNMMCKSTNELQGPASFNSAVINDQITYRNRIYCVFITNNYAGSDITIAGSLIMRFVDA